MDNKCFQILFSIIFLTTVVVKARESISCPLIWTEGSTGAAVPLDAVTMIQNERTHFVARFISNATSALIGGRMTEGVALGVENEAAVQSNSFEILTNPHKCVIAWKKVWAISPKFVVPFDPTTTMTSLVGRVYTENVAMAGSVSSDLETLSLVNSGLKPVKFGSMYFEILQSTLPGLRLKFTRHQFSRNPFDAAKDFMGLDVIHNKADTVVSQTVTQRKKLVEHVRFASESSWSHVAKVEFKGEPEFTIEELDMTLPSIGFDLSFEVPVYQSGSSQEKVSYREFDITVTRSVQIPPFTSVQICSTVTIAENFQMSFTARAEFSSPGLNADEIYNILQQDGVAGVTKDGDICVKEEEGQVGGTLAILTQFIAVPYNDDDGSGGCAGLSRKIDELKSVLNNLNSTRAERRHSFVEVEKFIQNLKKI